MNFIRLDPAPQLAHLIECYWIIENQSPDGQPQKIIPDGFTELVFHYQNQFQININGQWEDQDKYLIAGQISRFFYLRDTGVAGMVAVKFKPAALTQLFGLTMQEFTDRTIALKDLSDPKLNQLHQQILPYPGPETAKQIFDRFFIAMLPIAETPINVALDLIFKRKGLVTVKQLADEAQMGDRQLGRLFLKYIGLSPKYYCRIIRFNYIYELIQDRKRPWAEIVYLSGYYDQSHFIRDFKAFTGEDPSSYAFDAENMANFFLNKH
ncbi:MAG: helix-turn-helix domain-containing protein [Pedobacter sp.]|nr:helix-turn-helix domain-containing protein [Pedobacter sp.]